MAGIEAARIFATLSLVDNMTGPLRAADRAINGFGDSLGNIGGKLQGLGGAMTAIGAPVAAAFGGAAIAAMDFNEAMTNIQAVTGRSGDEIANLAGDLLDMGEASRYGPQAVAESMYDIVGGVADASTHMDILAAAISTAQAGNADLGSTTSALISIMNSYGFSAEEAAFASDVLTRTVGVGVGTMDEFAGALPMVAGLASSLGIEFDDLGAAMAFLTTKGFSASDAATQLRAMMTALLNPNERMKKAFQELGVASGAAAIEQYGLVGAFAALNEQSPTFQSEMAGTLGSIEALNGVIALTGDGVAETLENFSDGLDAATISAEAFQMASPAAQFDLLKSSVSRLAIDVGNALLPALRELFVIVKPILQDIAAWASANPELVAQIAGLAAAAAVLGPVLIAVGTALSSIGAIVAVIASPIGVAIAAVAALGAAYHTNFGGIKDYIDGEVMPRLEEFFTWLGGVWEIVQPALDMLFNWFVTERLPEIVAFVQDNVLPPLQTFFGYLAAIWEFISPALGEMFNWFVNTGLPAIFHFVHDTVLPAFEDFIGLIGGIWAAVGPALNSLFNWFSENIPKMVGFVQSVIDKIGELVEAINNNPLVGRRLDVSADNALAERARNSIGARADGGPVLAGGTYLVGERGPELLTMGGRGGSITPNEQMGGGDTYNISVMMPAAALVSPGAARQAGEDFGQAIKERLAARGG